MKTFIMHLRQLLGSAALIVALTLSNSVQAVIITKEPDVGPFWQPLSSSGTYVYANSFISPEIGTVTKLGSWLIGGESQYVFEVLADTGGNGPDGASVLASTAVKSSNYDSLNYVEFAASTSQVLSTGQTYWFAISTVGLGGSGDYQVGSHTQNSIYDDNGTFWYSNDPNGLIFDGMNLTPEMAFSITIDSTAVPEPANLAVLGYGLIAVVALRRRRNALVSGWFAAP